MHLNSPATIAVKCLKTNRLKQLALCKDRMSETLQKSPVRHLIVAEDCDGQRLDNFLLRELKGLPKARLYRLLRKGELRVNKKRVKPDYRVIAGDDIRIPPLQLATVAAPAKPSDQLLQELKASIVLEDELLLVLNKPSGLAVHGGSGLRLGLIEALRQLYPEQRFLELVHRLDRDTSGLILVAKKRVALKALHEQLRSKQVDKRYLALVKGAWPARKQHVIAALEKNTLQSGERMVRESVDGKPSRTEYSVLERFQGASLVEARPLTGRTHQIRVHCQIGGHPILGDVKYGLDEDNKQAKRMGLSRLFLHAYRLQFELEGRSYRLEAPLPEALENVLQRYRQVSISGQVKA